MYKFSRKSKFVNELRRVRPNVYLMNEKGNKSTFVYSFNSDPQEEQRI